MSHSLKISLHGGLKRLISSLICLSMILSTFPLLLLKSMVCAGDNTTITVTLSDLNNVPNWLNNDLSTNKLSGKSTINITINTNLTANNQATTMTTGNGEKYLFDFSDSRFNGKIINISGNSNVRSINISNPNLFFLYMKYGTVNLENITINGNNQIRQGAFIILEKDGSSTPILNVGQNAKIQNCINRGRNGGTGQDGEDALGGAIYCKGGQVTIGVGSGVNLANNAQITSCQAIGGNGGNGKNGLPGCDGQDGGNGGRGKGGAIYCCGCGKIVLNNGTISNCLSVYGGGGNGGNGDPSKLEKDEIYNNVFCIYHRKDKNGKMIPDAVSQLKIRNKGKGGNGGAGANITQ